MKRIFTNGVISLTILFFTHTASSQEIASWNFNNNLNGICGSNMTTAPVSFSPFISTRAYNAGTEYYGQGAWPTGGINTSAYLEFSLAPNTGFLLNLLSIEFRMRRSNTGSPAGSGPTQYTIRSSIDGYTTNLAWGTISHNYQNYYFLPGALFGLLPTNVSFRIYGHNAGTGSGGQSRLVFDHIRINGLGEILPVRLTHFNARKSGEHVAIQFKLDNTTIGDKYHIERSVNGSNWESIHSITENRSANEITHSFNDMQIPSSRQLYYRVKINELNGKESLSSTATILHAAAKFTARYSGGTLQINTSNSYKVQLVVANSAGQQLIRRELLPGQQSLHLPLTGVSPGIYYASIIDEHGPSSLAITVN